jgi:hypothetical protein
MSQPCFTIIVTKSTLHAGSMFVSEKPTYTASTIPYTSIAVVSAHSIEEAVKRLKEILLYYVVRPKVELVDIIHIPYDELIVESIISS